MTLPPSAGNCNRKFPERAVFSGSRLAKDTVIGYTVKQPEGNCTRLDSGYETSQRTGGGAPRSFFIQSGSRQIS